MFIPALDAAVTLDTCFLCLQQLTQTALLPLRLHCHPDLFQLVLLYWFATFILLPHINWFNLSLLYMPAVPCHTLSVTIIYFTLSPSSPFLAFLPVSLPAAWFFFTPSRHLPASSLPLKHASGYT